MSNVPYSKSPMPFKSPLNVIVSPGVDALLDSTMETFNFLALYDKVLAKDGYIQFKTDNRPLFDFSVESVQEQSNQLGLQHFSFQDKMK